MVTIKRSRKAPLEQPVKKSPARPVSQSTVNSESLPTQFGDAFALPVLNFNSLTQCASDTIVIPQILADVSENNDSLGVEENGNSFRLVPYAPSSGTTVPWPGDGSLSQLGMSGTDSHLGFESSRTFTIPASHNRVGSLITDVKKAISSTALSVYYSRVSVDSLKLLFDKLVSQNESTSNTADGVCAWLGAGGGVSSHVNFKAHAYLSSSFAVVTNSLCSASLKRRLRTTRTSHDEVNNGRSIQVKGVFAVRSLVACLRADLMESSHSTGMNAFNLSLVSNQLIARESTVVVPELEFHKPVAGVTNDASVTLSFSRPAPTQLIDSVGVLISTASILSSTNDREKHQNSLAVVSGG